jgi:GNAT superfamily N-acetyltransferase
MKTRPATSEDAAAIAEVFVAGQELWAQEGDDAPAAMEPPPIHGGELVAEDDDGIAGFAIIKGCEVDLLFTHPRAWGQGAGRALIVAAEDALRDASCGGDVTLWTEERNSRARRVIQASGWRKTKEIRERVWNGASLRELRYRKRL